MKAEQAESVAQPNVEGSMSGRQLPAVGRAILKNTVGGDDCSYGSPSAKRTLLKVIHDYARWI